MLDRVLRRPAQADQTPLARPWRRLATEADGRQLMLRGQLLATRYLKNAVPATARHL